MAKANRAARRGHKKGRKHNGHKRSHARRHGHKRNDGSMGGSTFMRALKGFGIALGAAVLGTGAMLLVSMQSFNLGALAQAGILIGAGVVVAGAGVALGYPVFGIATAAGLATVGMNYLALYWGTRRNSADLVARVQQLTGTAAAPATAPAPPAAPATAPAPAPAPGGWVASTPAWPQGLPQSTGFGGFGNFTTAPYAANFG